MVLDLLEDDDIRVRSAAAKCFARYGRDLKNDKFVNLKIQFNVYLSQIIMAKFSHSSLGHSRGSSLLTVMH